MIIRGGKSVAASFVKSLGCSLIGRSHPVEPFSFTGARGISDGCCFGANSGLLGHFVFIPYSSYMVGFSLYLYLRRLSPFPAFSSRHNVGNPSREDRETALMRCLHHLRAASGEWSNLHVGLTATTPLFEEETYRKVCRMGRDAPFSAKMNHAHLHQGAILGHPF